MLHYERKQQPRESCTLSRGRHVFGTKLAEYYCLPIVPCPRKKSKTELALSNEMDSGTEGVGRIVGQDPILFQRLGMQK